MCKIWTLTILALLFELSTANQPRPIAELHGLTKMPKFQMFTGYLNVSSDQQFFYWLNECTHNHSKKLIIWFNGGPGCSSLYGLFEENGPYKIDDETLKLHRNPHSWNKLAHILYIESPTGVGFSPLNPNTSITDQQVVVWNKNALRSFFILHPRYREADIYLAGESYAGVYISQLAANLLNQNNSINIKGVMIANGLLHSIITLSTEVDYAYYHGFISKKLWKTLKFWGCYDSIENYQLARCRRKIEKFEEIIHNRGLNPYNFLESCFTPQNPFIPTEDAPYNSTDDPLPPYMPTDDHLPPYTPTDDPMSRIMAGMICINTTAVEKYLNQIQLQNAIGIQRKVNWQTCSDEVFGNYVRVNTDVTEEIKSIIQKDIKTYLVYGDLDSVCNFLGGEAFVDQLGLNMTQHRKEWIVYHDDGSSEVGGYSKKFDNLSFYIVKGAGHMVPKDKPAEIYQLMKRFLRH